MCWYSRTTECADKSDVLGRCAQNLTKSLGKSFKSIFSSFFPGPCGLFPERQRFMFLFQKRQRFFINYIVWEGGIKKAWSVRSVRFFNQIFSDFERSDQFLGIRVVLDEHEICRRPTDWKEVISRIHTNIFLYSSLLIINNFITTECAEKSEDSDYSEYSEDSDYSENSDYSDYSDYSEYLMPPHKNARFFVFCEIMVNFAAKFQKSLNNVQNEYLWRA